LQARASSEVKGNASASSVELRHGALVVGGKVIASALAAFWMVVAARELSISDFADLSLVTALVVIAVQLADAGISVELPRAVVSSSGKGTRSYVREAVRRRARAGIPVSVVAMGAFLVGAQRASLIVAAGFTLSIIATAAYGAVSIGLRAKRRYRAEALLEPASRVLFLTAAVSALHLGAELEVVALVYGVTDLLTALAYRMALPPDEGRPSPRVTMGAFRWSHLAMPIAAVYWRIDTWLLALLSDATEVAVYGAGYRLLDAALLPALVIASMMPARVLEADPMERQKLVRRWATTAVATLVPFAVVVSFAAPSVLRLLFGPTFASGTTALRILAAAGLVSGAVLVFTSALATTDVARYFRAILAVSALTVVADLLLLSRYGAAGAAVVTLAGQAVLAVLLWRELRHL
jgi:O-antigen/teichoic acid export membrane protein